MPLSLLYAIPDHPWVDSGDGAAVRIAMTVGVAGDLVGEVRPVRSERAEQGEGLDVDLASSAGKITADLRAGAKVATAQPLLANSAISGMGVALHGSGFILTQV